VGTCAKLHLAQFVAGEQHLPDETISLGVDTFWRRQSETQRTHRTIAATHVALFRLAGDTKPRFGAAREPGAWLACLVLWKAAAPVSTFGR
jgi:hypothetical protein